MFAAPLRPLAAASRFIPLRPCCLLPRAATPPRCGSKGSMAAAHCKSLNQKSSAMIQALQRASIRTTRSHGNGYAHPSKKGQLYVESNRFNYGNFGHDVGGRCPRPRILARSRILVKLPHAFTFGRRKLVIRSTTEKSETLIREPSRYWVITSAWSLHSSNTTVVYFITRTRCGQNRRMAPATMTT